MDKIDEWLNKAFEAEKPSQVSIQKGPQHKNNKGSSRFAGALKSFAKKFSKQGKQVNNMNRQKNNKHQQNQRPQGQQFSQKAPKKEILPAHKHKTIQDFERVTHHQPTKKKRQNSQILQGKLKIIPLGGLDEVGKNMMIFEYEEDIIIVDMGFEFPGEDMLGIDYVIPDVSYLEENKKRIRGIVITHGHLDHVGGIPYILPRLDFPPVFATKLTVGLIKKRIDEFDLDKFAKLHTIDPNQPLRLGKFLVNFFRVAHSIPDSVGVVVETPIGKVVHTGDFKFDDNLGGIQKPADLEKMRALGGQNVLALLSDSTNALKPGHTMSEQQVGETLQKLVLETSGRLIVASFSSLIGRIQQIIEAAQKYNRKVFVSGKSMKDNINIANELGYLKFPKDFIKDIRKYKDIPDRETLILTTGSQGEAISALSRIANNEHPQIKLKKGDTIIISSNPIIGNERAIFAMINKLCLAGANVIYNQIMDVHTSGHGYQEELKEMINLIKPKYFVPIHGEYFMRKAHAALAHNDCKIPEDKIVMLQNGDVLIGEKEKLSTSPEKIETKYILIDGLGEGQKGSQVQFEREIMSENGVLIVLLTVSKKKKALIKEPDIISRGYIYMHESEIITQAISRIAAESYQNIRKKNPGANRNDIKKYVRQTIDNYTDKNLARRPLIVPIILEA